MKDGDKFILKNVHCSRNVIEILHILMKQKQRPKTHGRNQVSSHSTKKWSYFAVYTQFVRLAAVEKLLGR